MCVPAYVCMHVCMYVCMCVAYGCRRKSCKDRLLASGCHMRCVYVCVFQCMHMCVCVVYV